MVDGKERMIIIEGLAEGAMQRIEGIALQALTGALPQPNATCRRAVHWHQGLRYYSTLPKTVPSDWTVRNITAWTWSETHLLGHGQMYVHHMYVPVKLGLATLTEPV